MIYPTENGTYQGDGFFFNGTDLENQYWYKVSNGSSVTVKRTEKGIKPYPNVSSTCKAIALALRKDYYVGWVKKSNTDRTPPATNPFDN